MAMKQLGSKTLKGIVGCRVQVEIPCDEKKRYYPGRIVGQGGFSGIPKRISLIYKFGGGIVEVVKPKGEISEDYSLVRVYGGIQRYHFPDFGTSSIPEEDGKSLYQKLEEYLREEKVQESGEKKEGVKAEVETGEKKAGLDYLDTSRTYIVVYGKRLAERDIRKEVRADLKFYEEQGLVRYIQEGIWPSIVPGEPISFQDDKGLSDILRKENIARKMPERFPCNVFRARVEKIDGLQGIIDTMGIKGLKSTAYSLFGGKIL